MITASITFNFSGGLFSLALLIIAIILTVLLLSALRTKRWISKNLGTLALCVLAAGWIVYFLGFYAENIEPKPEHEVSFLALSLRSLLSSIEMFVSHSDLLEVGEECKGNAMYMAFFAVVHFLAVVISAAFAFTYLGTRFSSCWRRICWTIFSQKNKPLFVFFGENTISDVLVKDIYQKMKLENQTPHIVLIDTVENAEEQPQRMSFGHLFALFSYRRQTIAKLDDLGAVLLTTNVNLSDVSLVRGNADILHSICLDKLKKLIRKADAVYAFFMSEDEEKNLRMASKLSHDTTLCMVAGCNDNAENQQDKHKKVRIFCHARRNNVNLVVETESIFNNQCVDVRLIDSAKLAVHQLFRNPMYQPANFVKIEKDATVSTPFNALVLGFSECGRDAVRFLYEFGAFIASKTVYSRSPFCCTAVDANMDNLKGSFYMKTRAMNTPTDEYHQKALSDYIQLLQYDCNSQQFWQWLEPRLITMNYVVVALGNDEENMAVAIDLYELACQIRKNNLERFVIFVRSYLPENEERYNQIVDYYNTKNANSKGKIILFGQMHHLYTYSMIVDDKIEKDAIRYYAKYENLQNGEESWNLRRNESKDLNSIQDVIRKESQDIANSLHIFTKLQIAGINDFEESKGRFVVSKRQKDVLNEYYDSINKHVRNPNETEYQKADSFFQQKMINLAKIEHLRWEASHEMMGYVYGEEKNTLLKTHPSMIPWEKLDNKTRSYDCNVVDVSFQIAHEDVQNYKQ